MSRTLQPCFVRVLLRNAWPNHALRVLLAASLAVLSLSACSTEQIYGSAQGWQRNQCNRTPDKAEFDRCMAKASTSYESYKRQSESEQR